MHHKCFGNRPVLTSTRSSYLLLCLTLHFTMAQRRYSEIDQEKISSLPARKRCLFKFYLESAEAGRESLASEANNEPSTSRRAEASGEPSTSSVPSTSGGSSTSRGKSRSREPLTTSTISGEPTTGQVNNRPRQKEAKSQRRSSQELPAFIKRPVTRRESMKSKLFELGVPLEKVHCLLDKQSKVHRLNIHQQSRVDSEETVTELLKDIEKRIENENNYGYDSDSDDSF